MRAFDDPVDPIVYMREKARAIALLKSWSPTALLIPASGSLSKEGKPGAPGRDAGWREACGVQPARTASARREGLARLGADKA